MQKLVVFLALNLSDDECKKRVIEAASLSARRLNLVCTAAVVSFEPGPEPAEARKNPTDHVVDLYQAYGQPAANMVGNLCRTLGPPAANMAGNLCKTYGPPAANRAIQLGQICYSTVVRDKKPIPKHEGLRTKVNKHHRENPDKAKWFTCPQGAARIFEPENNKRGWIEQHQQINGTIYVDKEAALALELAIEK
ncbi:hypothetical protein C5167_047934 [Papaver somniferum]|uniref:Uncharacterized protein n=1 Tax=Papaver somniferum TaxID=3469 RepID=A0A4Y7KK58_PAPSO|nr:hypothetical protein C5167_047934 [Papaver somniferum]